MIQRFLCYTGVNPRSRERFFQPSPVDFHAFLYTATTVNSSTPNTRLPFLPEGLLILCLRPKKSLPYWPFSLQRLHAVAFFSVLFSPQDFVRLHSLPPPIYDPFLKALSVTLLPPLTEH